MSRVRLSCKDAVKMIQFLGRKYFCERDTNKLLRLVIKLRSGFFKQMEVMQTIGSFYECSVIKRFEPEIVQGKIQSLISALSEECSCFDGIQDMIKEEMPVGKMDAADSAREGPQEESGDQKKAKPVFCRCKDRKRILLGIRLRAARLMGRVTAKRGRRRIRDIPVKVDRERGSGGDHYRGDPNLANPDELPSEAITDISNVNSLVALSEHGSACSTPDYSFQTFDLSSFEEYDDKSFDFSQLGDYNAYSSILRSLTSEQYPTDIKAGDEGFTGF